MWHLKLKGGIEISENQLPYWDAVPKNIEIESMALIFPKNGGGHFIFDYRGYEEYCCARIGAASMEGEHRSVGYAVYLGKAGWVTQVDFLPDGIKTTVMARDKCELSEQAWRRGVS